MNLPNPLPPKLPLLSILHDGPTTLGRLILRRRHSLALERDVYEMLIDDNLMMSSAMFDSEQALAKRALEVLTHDTIRVLVGGLGFGFTVQAALADSRVTDVTVVEYLDAVIDWHRAGTFPWSHDLNADPRVHIVSDNFFSFLSTASRQELGYDAILIDIDDSPSSVWHNSHRHFYRASGFARAKRLLRPSGVLGLWFAEPPEADFLTIINEVFARVEVIDFAFDDPCNRRLAVNFLVLAHSRYGNHVPQVIRSKRSDDSDVDLDDHLDPNDSFELDIGGSG